MGIMTTIAAAEARDRISTSAEYGNVFAPISDLAQVHGMFGGEGVARWMQLFSPVYLAGGWDGTIEYVVLDPGVSCGAQLQDRRERIYYILAGSAAMRVNGQDLPVTAGDVITCPIGTRHWIGTPKTADEPVAFLVVEMLPRAAGLPHEFRQIPMGERVTDALGWWGYPGDDLDIATVNLRQHLTGPWATFTQAEIPPNMLPDTVIGPHQPLRGTAELVLPVSGEAVITVGDEQVKCGPGLPGLAIGAVSPVTVRNPSSSRPLKLITLSVVP
jgi:mannose-6-phosphate isomerase-like protein (cupin superfamily)